MWSAGPSIIPIAENKLIMMKKVNLYLLIITTLISCNTRKDTSLKIESPFNNLDVPSIIIKVNPTKKQVARFENGVSIEIPENAFVDIDGNIIKEEVTLTLTSFNSPAEIIASGIPRPTLIMKPLVILRVPGCFKYLAKLIQQKYLLLTTKS